MVNIKTERLEICEFTPNNPLALFDEKNMSQVVERVLPLWRAEGMPEDFNRLYVEMIIRTNMHQNQEQFQLSENGELKAIAFCARKTDGKDNSWYNSTWEKLPQKQKELFSKGRSYLLQMDQKVFSMMNENDVKLCLFVSLKAGWGSRIFNALLSHLKHTAATPHNLYLWTDGECNVDWYFQNDFELVSQEEYKPFSTEKGAYMTYIFRKKL